MAFQKLLAVLQRPNIWERNFYSGKIPPNISSEMLVENPNQLKSSLAPPLKYGPAESRMLSVRLFGNLSYSQKIAAVQIEITLKVPPGE